MARKSSHKKENKSTIDKKQKKLYSIIIAIACLFAVIIMYNGIIMMLYSTSRITTFWGFALFLFGLYILFTNKVEKIIKRLFDK